MRNALDVAHELESMRRVQINRLPPSMEQFAHQSPYYIYNVCTHPFAAGSRVLTARKADERYGIPVEIPSYVKEQSPTSEINVYNTILLDGLDYAKSLIHAGAFQDPQHSLEKWGVFVSTNNPPSEEELKTAESRRDVQYASLVREADDFYAQGPDQLKNIHFLHRIAARELGLTRDWLQDIVRAASCPACGESVKPRIVICPHCRAILDKKRAAEFGLLAPSPVATAPAQPTPGQPIANVPRGTPQVPPTLKL